MFAIRFAGAKTTRVAATGSADDGVAMPTMANGERPRYVYVCHDGGTTETEVLFINFGASTVTVLVTNGLMLSAHHPLVIDVSGFTHFAVIAAATATSFSITPLENG